MLLCYVPRASRSLHHRKRFSGSTMATGSSYSSHKRYKADTNAAAVWLFATAGKHGCHEYGARETPASTISSRPKGKARKADKTSGAAAQGASGRECRHQVKTITKDLDKYLLHLHDESATWTEGDGIHAIINRQQSVKDPSDAAHTPQLFLLQRDPLWCGLLLYCSSTRDRR